MAASASGLMSSTARPLSVCAALRSVPASSSLTGGVFAARHVGASIRPLSAQSVRVEESESEVLVEDSEGAELEVKTDEPAPASIFGEAGSVTEIPEHKKPGLLDSAFFTEHESVEFWRDFQFPPKDSGANLDDFAGIQRYFQLALDNAAGAGVLANSAATQYWAYHTLRSVFFSLQGVAGTIGNSIAKGEGFGSVNGITGQPLSLSDFLKRGFNGPVVEAMGMFTQDYKNVTQGVYKMPWDYDEGLRHRQANPFWVLNKAAGFVREAAATLQRSESKTADEMWMGSKMYPDYYLNTWHYQTDGWLSARSANVYETSTETLFAGRQDAMQRASLVPVHEYMKSKSRNDLWSMKALEVAAGTGRFATFFKDNYPEMLLTVTELSPFYLQNARENMEYWKSLRAPNKNLGGWRGTGAAFMQAAAEELPVPDESQDIVTCTYLFHEMPMPVRMAQLREMVRVLKPGGLLVINDAAQIGDRERLDAINSAKNFQTFNEPHFMDYALTDFGSAFKTVGLEPDMKLLASASKVLSARKPL